MNNNTDFKRSLQVRGLGKVVVRNLGTITAADLNAAAARSYNSFNTNNTAQPFANSIGATNDVKLYRVNYKTTIPENDNTYRVSGLLAVPSLAKSEPLRMVSWQHGTILSPLDAPSQLATNNGRGTAVIQKGIFPSEFRTEETLLNVAKFAGNGYALAAADYIGNGTSKAARAWGVKEATQQTIADMLKASRSFLRKQGYERGPLFSLGWSQGGLNTAWLGEKLQNQGIALKRQATLSGPLDLPNIISYWFNDYPGNPPWLTSLTPILIGSYEKYYGIQNLMEKAIRPEYLKTSRKIYNNKVDWNDPKIYGGISPGKGLLGLPDKPKDMLTGEFIQQFNNKRGAFYKRVSKNTTLTVKYDALTRFYGGKDDGAAPEPFSIDSPLNYQKQLGSSTVEGISVGELADHRSTFLGGLFGSASDPSINLLDWFNAA